MPPAKVPGPGAGLAAAETFGLCGLRLSPKLGSLALLTLSSALLPIVLRIARGPNAAGYSALASVAYVELFKIVSSSFILGCKRGGAKNAFDVLMDTTVTRPKTVLLLVVPAVLYTIQNTAILYAIETLSAAQYAVTRQMKIPVTGIFSVVLLGRELGLRKWLGIIMLTVGVAVVQLTKVSDKAGYKPHAGFSHGSDPGDAVSAMESLHEGYLESETVGLIFALSSCITSGLAAVWFEKLLKAEQVDLWVMNIQLATISFLLALVCALITEGAEAFLGFDEPAYFAVACIAIDGLIIALVMKYADNILKGFATSAAICMTATLSVLQGDMVFSPQLALGCGTVGLAVIIYSGGLMLPLQDAQGADKARDLETGGAPGSGQGSELDKRKTSSAG